MAALDHMSFVRGRGARENNLKNIDVEIPRDAIMVRISLAACLLPSRRAARISPMEALTES